MSEYIELRTSTVARLLGITTRQVRALIHGPELDGIRRGSRYFVTAAALGRYCRSHA